MFYRNFYPAPGYTNILQFRWNFVRRTLSQSVPALIIPFLVTRVIGTRYLRQSTGNFDFRAMKYPGTAEYRACAWNINECRAGASGEWTNSVNTPVELKLIPIRMSSQRYSVCERPPGASTSEWARKWLSTRVPTLLFSCQSAAFLYYWELRINIRSSTVFPIDSFILAGPRIISSALN